MIQRKGKEEGMINVVLEGGGRVAGKTEKKKDKERRWMEGREEGWEVEA